MSQTAQGKVTQVHTQVQQGSFGQCLLNSMIGEYLEKENNPLAIKMGFFHQSKSLSFDTPLHGQLGFPVSNRVVIFVHGLTNHESIWHYPPGDGSTESIVSHYIDVCLDSKRSPDEQSYGKKLQEEFGFTPLYLRYNTGLSLEKNARKFVALVNQLFAAYPITIDELIFVGFGMGGKLLSHAQYAAVKSESSWLPVLSKCMYLGNLNEGSLLAIILQVSSNIIRNLPVFYNDALADWLEYRSKHIQLNSLSQENSEKKPTSTSAMFCEKTRHYFVNGNVVRKEQNIFGRDSAETATQQHSLVPVEAPSHSQNVFLENIYPFRLANSDRVYSLMAKWFGNAMAMTEIENTLPTMSSSAASQLAVSDLDMTPADRPSNRVFIAGTVDFVASAFEKTIETFETAHYSLAEEPFYVLEKLPVVSQMAKPIEAVQRDLLDSFYRSMRSRGRMMHQFAAEIE